MSDPAIEPSTAAEPAADDPTAAVNGLAQLSFTIIPAFVAALAAIGGATGGLARLFRDQTSAATLAIALILLSLALAATARGIGSSSSSRGSRSAGAGPSRLRTKAGLLFLSIAVLFVGLFIAIRAQIGVMGTSQAPQVFGNVQKADTDWQFVGGVKASGVRSRDRITIYSYQTTDAEVSANRPALLHSSIGPDANGVVDIPLEIPVGSQAWGGPLVVVTAVLGEENRNCEGQVAGQDAASVDTARVACLVLRLP